MARPTVITPEVIAKLEQAFAIDSTVEEACSYADISRDAFYDYLKKEPEFSDRIADLRQRPVLKARETIVKSLTDPHHAFKYMERKRKSEFGPNVDVTSNGDKITFVPSELLDKHAITEQHPSSEPSNNS